MAYWKRTIRRINGRRRVVKVHSGKYGSGRVRVIGRRNTTDRNAPRGSRRKRRYYNTTDNHNKRERQLGRFGF